MGILGCAYEPLDWSYGRRHIAGGLDLSTDYQKSRHSRLDVLGCCDSLFLNFCFSRMERRTQGAAWRKEEERSVISGRTSREHNRPARVRPRHPAPRESRSGPSDNANESWCCQRDKGLAVMDY